MIHPITKTVVAASIRGDLLPRLYDDEATGATEDLLGLIVQEIHDPICQGLIGDITDGRELTAAAWLFAFARSQNPNYLSSIGPDREETFVEVFAELIRRWVDERPFEEVVSQLTEWHLEAA
ncbi:hypothetical protein E0H39_29535 [Rhizobium leguminosarum bv. viciae]|uniref:hypothetical protein n=1 Tax=Rhizobium leguminosarum TaxID=384 RepID=UPI00103DBC68|nr:hypothetical protein [Rhizobium leguminosarum]TBY57962.1 hypothetical protein E0H39_29535 [Rhizobium leguminosarum bv. viciae]